MKVDVVLPAGGRISGDFASEAGSDLKALARLGEATVLERTLAAVRNSGCAGRIVVVGPPAIEMAAASLADVVLPGGCSGSVNVLRGLHWLYTTNKSDRPDRVMVVTTDLPFITPEAIADFVDRCPPQLDLCVPVISRQEFEARFFRASGRCVRLRDGQWMIGCAFLLDPAAILANRRAVERVFAARRSQLGMARLLGPMFIYRFVTGKLTISAIEKRALSILGCSGAAIRGCPPELAFDIDYPADYRYAIQHRAWSDIPLALNGIG